jgi:DNA-binding LacI/PurR family transcriptional regulator/PAS domain-containing protein
MTDRIRPEQLHDLRGRTIAVLSPAFTDEYFAVVLSALARAVNEAGGCMVAVQTHYSSFSTSQCQYHATVPNNIAGLGIGRMDAFVVVLGSAPREHLESLRANGKPLVMFSHEEPGFACPIVVPDNHSGVGTAVEHLLWHGHRRIAFAGNLAQHDIRQRYEAYRGTLQANGMEPDPALLFPAVDNDIASGYGAGRLMVAAGLPSTAVVAGNDYNAIGIINALHDAGYNVPVDQAVVGFDNIHDCALMNPALSTISQDFNGAANKVVQLLGSQLGGEPVEARHHEIETSFVPRETCGCVSTVLPVLPTPRQHDPLRQFVDRVAEVLGLRARTSVAPVRTSTAARATELSEKIARVFMAAVEREPAPAELIGIVQACDELYSLGPSPRAYSLSVVAAGLARSLRQAAMATTTTAPGPRDVDAMDARLDRCLEQVSAGFSRAGVLNEVEAYNQFRGTARNDYTTISMQLLRNHEEDPRSLQWMAMTAARAGMLALWKDGPASRELEVVGRYETNPEARCSPSTSFRVEHFPPAEVIERCGDEAGGGLVLLLPVRTLSKDWGFLALVVPIDAISAVQETYLQWSTLLSEALGYEAVTTSLKQSEERYALAARAANDGLWDWDLTTGTIYYSSRWKRMLGGCGSPGVTFTQPWEEHR